MNKFIKTALDTAEIVGKTVVSTIPIGGAMITAVYDTVKNNCLAKRQQKWQKVIELRLSKLEKTLEEIGNNEFFAAALIKTTESAMNSPSEEKLCYLAEALANSIEESVDETKLLIFLNLIDKYTVAHIKLLENYYQGCIEVWEDKELQQKILCLQEFFHENFQMYPISAKRMIVEISPFYKFRQMCSWRYKMPELKDLTELPNENLYTPNLAVYVKTQTDALIPQYHPDDLYIYDIKKLSSAETRYCNELFLDRINTHLGFSSLRKAVRSIVQYKRDNSYPYTPRVDYTDLYRQIIGVITHIGQLIPCVDIFIASYY